MKNKNFKIGIHLSSKLYKYIYYNINNFNNVKTCFKFNPFDCDLIIFQRGAHHKILPLYFTVLKLFGILIIWDIDDLLWNLPIEISNTIPKYKNKKLILNNINKIINLSNAIITDTLELKKEIEKITDKKVFIIQSCINVNIEEVLLPKKLQEIYNNNSDYIVISNSDTLKINKNDYKNFIIALDTFLEKNNNFKLLLIGSYPMLIKDLKPDKFVNIPRIDDYPTYLSLIRNNKIKFGLIPVSENSYSNCKSNIKILDFLRSGVPIICSSIKPYLNIINDFPLLNKSIMFSDNSQRSWKLALNNYNKLSIDINYTEFVLSETLKRNNNNFIYTINYIKNNFKNKKKSYNFVFKYLFKVTIYPFLKFNLFQKYFKMHN